LAVVALEWQPLGALGADIETFGQQPGFQAAQFSAALESALNGGVRSSGAASTRPLGFRPNTWARTRWA
jgi:hypothetical protein